MVEDIDMSPLCVGCEERVEKPSDCDIELFRVGVPVHWKCLKIYTNVDSKVRQLYELSTGG